jgi:hypothetical protein
MIKYLFFLAVLISPLSAFAEQWFAATQHNLGLKYEGGRGVAKNDHRAFEGVQKVAGHAEAKSGKAMKVASDVETFDAKLKALVDSVGATPLVVSDGRRVLGLVELSFLLYPAGVIPNVDALVKSGIEKQYARLRAMGAKGSQITLSGDGLDFALEFSKGLARYSLRGGAPRFEHAADGARLTLRGLAVESAQQRLFPDGLLYTGTWKLSIAGLEVDPGQPPKIALKDFIYEAETSASGEYIDMAARCAAELAIHAAAFDFGPVAFDFSGSMKHLHARKLMAINRDFAELVELYARPGMPRDKERARRTMMPVLSRLSDWLQENPVLSIDRIVFRMPWGEAAASANIRLVDVGAEDLLQPQMLVGKIDAEVDLSLSVTLVRTLLALGKAGGEEERRKRGEAFDGKIAHWVQEGYVTIAGDILRSRLTFKNGLLTANGRQVASLPETPKSVH